MFHQTKWVDNWPNQTWTTLEEAQAFSESYWIGDKYHAKLIKRGAKVRFINVDAGDKYDYQ